MKKIAILFLILILCSCSADINHVFDDLDIAFASFQKKEDINYVNNNTKYYSFYLPSDINEIEYGDTFHHLIFNDSDFVMSLNVNGILSKNIFGTDAGNPYDFLKDYMIYENYLEGDNPFKFDLYFISNDLYFSFITNKLSFFGATTYSNVIELCKHLLVINDSVKIDDTKVVDDFYSGTAIDSTHEAVDLFDTYHPLNGDVQDLLPD